MCNWGIYSNSAITLLECSARRNLLVRSAVSKSLHEVQLQTSDPLEGHKQAQSSAKS